VGFIWEQLYCYQDNSLKVLEFNHAQALGIIISPVGDFADRSYQHSGPDWRARIHAGWQNVLARRVVRGASTITEQCVRMLHPRPRTPWSRWVEGFEATMLEQQFSKAEILEFYLNQVPYSHQRRGVTQAARYYFDRDLDTLSLREMLALAVLVRSPSRLDLRQGFRRPSAY